MGAFDAAGQAFLFSTSGIEETAENCSIPGFAAIGTGSGNAMFWLSRREHAMNMNVRRASYHAYEAKLMAESAPGVNKHLDCIVAQKGKYWNLSTHRRNEVKEDCPITFDWLHKQFRKFGVRNTDALGK